MQDLRQDKTNSGTGLKQAFSTALRQWKPALIVYAVQFALALTVGMQVYEVLKASIGNSLEINKLLHGYDHTVLIDFFRVHGASITPLIGQLRWMILVWLVFSVFLNAGLMACIVHPDRAGASYFWSSGAAAFFPFLKTAAFFLLVLLVWTALALSPLAVFLAPMLERTPNEQKGLALAGIVLFVYACGIGIIWLWSVLSRAVYLQGGRGVRAAIGQGRSVLSAGRGRLIFLAALFFAIQLLLLLVYWQVESAVGMRTAFTVLLLFLWQQMNVFFRITVRQTMYSAVAIYCLEK